jgi:hypothetical protein
MFRLVPMIIILVSTRPVLFAAVASGPFRLLV